MWQPQWYHLEDKSEDNRDTLDIPVPSKSPSTLNCSTDYQTKASFLQILGLKSVPVPVRQGIIAKHSNYISNDWSSLKINNNNDRHF